MSIAEKVHGLGGRTLGDEELRVLRDAVVVPDALIDQMRRLPLIGLNLSLAKDADRSGLGVDMQWMDAAEMIREAIETYPGIVALKLGYVAVGKCLIGSGDPYFFRSSDGAIVRVPHDAASETELDEGQVELVAESLETLLERAAIEPP